MGAGLRSRSKRIALALGMMLIQTLPPSVALTHMLKIRWSTMSRTNTAATVHMQLWQVRTRRHLNMPAPANEGAAHSSLLMCEM